MSGLLIPDYHRRVQNLTPERRHMAGVLRDRCNALTGMLGGYLAALLLEQPTTGTGAAALLHVSLLCAACITAPYVARRMTNGFLLNMLGSGRTYMACSIGAAVLADVYGHTLHSTTLLACGPVTLLLGVLQQLTALHILLGEVPKGPRRARRALTLPGVRNGANAFVPVPVPARVNGRPGAR